MSIYFLLTKKSYPNIFHILWTKIIVVTPKYLLYFLQNIHYIPTVSPAETPECWSLQFLTEAIFAIWIYIYRKFPQICRQFRHLGEIVYKYGLCMDKGSSAAFQGFCRTDRCTVKKSFKTF